MKSSLYVVASLLLAGVVGCGGSTASTSYASAEGLKNLETKVDGLSAKHDATLVLVNAHHAEIKEMGEGLTTLNVALGKGEDGKFAALTNAEGKSWQEAFDALAAKSSQVQEPLDSQAGLPEGLPDPTQLALFSPTKQVETQVAQNVQQSDPSTALPPMQPPADVHLPDQGQGNSQKRFEIRSYDLHQGYMNIYDTSDGRWYRWSWSPNQNQPAQVSVYGWCHKRKCHRWWRRHGKCWR